MSRTSPEDIEVGGQLIRAGEGIILAIDAGNRDAAAFPDPDRLDIHRQARHHVAFGFGVRSHGWATRVVARRDTLTT